MKKNILARVITVSVFLISYPLGLLFVKDDVIFSFLIGFVLQILIFCLYSVIKELLG